MPAPLTPDQAKRVVRRLLRDHDSITARSIRARLDRGTDAQWIAAHDAAVTALTGASGDWTDIHRTAFDALRDTLNNWKS